MGRNFADGPPKGLEFLGVGECRTGYQWFWTVSRFPTILQLRCSLIHSVLQASTPLSFTSFYLKLGKLNKGMISFQLVQSTPRYNEVSNRKDRILAHSPGRGSGVQGLLQVSLSWGWGPIGELELLTGETQSSLFSVSEKLRELERVKSQWQESIWVFWGTQFARLGGQYSLLG